MSKQIQKYIDKHPEKFESWHNENHNERGLDYWVYTTSDHICPDMECGTIHEDTVAETLSMMRTVRKMNAEELKREAEQNARFSRRPSEVGGSQESRT